MNHSQRALAAVRDRGHQRVGQVTRWTAAAGGLAVAVIGVVLAQAPASASTAAAPATSQPGGASGTGTQGGLGGYSTDTAPTAPQYQYSPQYGGQGLQAPAYPPQSSGGSGSSVLSGGS